MSEVKMVETVQHPDGSDTTIERITAIFSDLSAAERTRATLLEHCVRAESIEILSTSAQLATWRQRHPDMSQDVLHEGLIDGAIGTAVGTGVGALGSIAFAAANMTLFVASPVIAPLAMLGWFAGLGGFVGAAVGVSKKTPEFTALATDAITAGHPLLVVTTRDTLEYDRAHAIVAQELGLEPPASSG